MQKKLEQFVDEFIKEHTNGVYGFPRGQYVGECLSLVKLFIQDFYGIYPPASGCNGARCYWSNFPNPLGTVLKKVPNTPDLIPLKGWIPVWNKNAGYGYGHIGIIVEADINSFISFDQNYNGKHAHKVKHNYNNVEGFLAPKDDVDNHVDNSALESCIADDMMEIKKSEFTRLIDEANSRDEDIKELKAERNNMGEAYKQSQNSFEAEEEAHKATKREYAGFRDQLADIYGSVHSNESVIKFATENSKVIDERNEYQVKYEKEVQARKEDYVKHQNEVKDLQKQLDDLKAQNDRLASKLSNLGLQITNKLDEVDEAKEAVDNTTPIKHGLNILERLRNTLIVIFKRG